MAKGGKTRTLPKLFSLTPNPSLQWRFIDIDAETLATILSLRYPKTHDERTAIFKTVFDFEKYRFNE